VQKKQSRTLLIAIAILSLGTLPGCELGPHGDGKVETSSSGTSADMPTTSGVSTTSEQTTDAPPGETSSSTSEELTTSPSTSDESSSTTTPPSECGNRMHESGEECDDGNLESGDLCSFDCTREFVVFVTKQRFDGALQPQASRETDLGTGLEAVDGICQNAAKKFLPEESSTKFKAWLAGDALPSAPSSRFSEVLRTTTKPIHLLGTESDLLGVVIANGWVDLVDGHLQSAIDVTEERSFVDQSLNLTWVWTNVDPNGNRVNGNNCDQWSSNAMNKAPVITGSTLQSDEMWTQHTTPGGCEFYKHFYCFSQ